MSWNESDLSEKKKVQQKRNEEDMGSDNLYVFTEETDYWAGDKIG